MIPTFFEKCVATLISLANKHREDAGDGVLDLSFLSEMNRMSNNLQMLQQRKHDLLHHFRPLSVASI